MYAGDLELDERRLPKLPAPRFWGAAVAASALLAIVKMLEVSGTGSPCVCVHFRTNSTWQALSVGLHWYCILIE
jgi:hypothetical protein